MDEQGPQQHGPDQRARMVLLADDLTGALDCAAAFAGRGVSSFVSAGRDIAGAPGADLVSVNMDTRRMPARDAAAVVADAVAAARAAGRRPRYVKIDSTLRGHPGVEIGAAAGGVGGAAGGRDAGVPGDGAHGGRRPPLGARRARWRRPRSAATR